MARMISFPQISPANQQEESIKNWRIMVKDLKIEAFLGIYDHEKVKPQPIQINVECDLLMPVPQDIPTSEHVFCYDQLVTSITKLASVSHIYLVETLAEQIADYCLTDSRVHKVMVRIEKTQIYTNAASAGVEIIRSRKPSTPQKVVS